MADKKISQLTSLAQGDIATTTDVLAIVDTSATETKKATPAAIVGAAAAAGLTSVDINSGAIDGTTIGANSAAAGTFTNLTASGTVSFSGATVSNGGSVTTVDINGGTIDGASVGASSASTGAFTTLTTSSTVTLNGGTANGVLYLNASKVATSGSALTFDGTRLTVKGGNANSLWVDNGGQQYTELDLANNGTVKASIWWDNTNTNLFFNSTGSTTYSSAAANYHSWNISSEQMRLTSTGLGIGTTSPAGKLHVVGDSLSNTFKLIANTSVSGSDATIFRPADNTMAFSTNGLERLRIDSSGNLGLGVTPSAWGSGRRVLQMGTTPYIMGSGTSLEFLANAYYDGTNWIYNANGAVAYYAMNSGAHSWYTAASGTAGNAITFTQAMTLDASGNLGIGTTSPGQKLGVAGNQRFTGSQVGTKIENRNTAISVTTSAVTILDESGGLGRFVVVNGDSGGDRFCDLVLCSTSVSPTVVSSFTALGTPAARTYTRSGAALQLAMASGTYDVFALAIGF